MPYGLTSSASDPEAVRRAKLVEEATKRRRLIRENKTAQNEKVIAGRAPDVQDAIRAKRIANFAAEDASRALLPTRAPVTPEQTESNDRANKAAQLRALLQAGQRDQATATAAPVAEDVRAKAVQAGRMRLYSEKRPDLAGNEDFAAYLGGQQPPAPDQGKIAAQQRLAQMLPVVQRRRQELQGLETAPVGETQDRYGTQAARLNESIARSNAGTEVAQGAAEENAARRAADIARMQKFRVASEEGAIREQEARGVKSPAEQLASAQAQTEILKQKRMQDALANQRVTAEEVEERSKARENALSWAGFNTTAAFTNWQNNAKDIVRRRPQDWETFVLPTLNKIAEVSPEEAEAQALDLLDSIPEESFAQSFKDMFTFADASNLTGPTWYLSVINKAKARAEGRNKVRGFIDR